MKQSSTTTSSLKPPGQSQATPRHQLRQRSPQGQRGRSRKDKLVSPNPPLPLSLLERVRQSSLFVPLLVLLGVLVLGLLYSAIRISSHTADYYPSHAPAPPVRPAKKPRIGRPGAPPDSNPLERPESHSSTPGKKQTIRVGEGEVEEAIRSALEETWHLSSSSQAVSHENEMHEVSDEDSIRGEDNEGKERKQRSLSELYEELDGLGISVDELNEVLQGAIGGNL
ncbi:hypothetical protein JCM16303_002474 [Sporobolomyces ruberrimus]